ncbi:RYamide receptor-like [Periplaneta americana]|uniref:RYamide receptor-like n=1 Tax=Periplaneta americana TaxID=6978 RepID=UPI0037E8F3C9
MHTILLEQRVYTHCSVNKYIHPTEFLGELERYNAIMHPFERRFTKLRTKLILAGIWLVAIAISAIQLRVARSERFKYGGEWHWDCGEHWGSPEDGQSYTMLIFSVTFAVPLLSLAFTYTCVGRRLWLRAAPGNADPTRDLAQLRAKRKIIKMLVTIVVLFALCWLPLQTFLLLYYFVPGFDSLDSDHDRKVYALSYFACHWLANANSMVNPFVYCFMSDNFRRRAGGHSQEKENVSGIEPEIPESEVSAMATPIKDQDHRGRTGQKTPVEKPREVLGPAAAWRMGVRHVTLRGTEDRIQLGWKYRIDLNGRRRREK